MSVKEELRSKLKWYERSDALTENDTRVARLAFEATPQSYVEMGYVSQYKGKYYWAIVCPKLPGVTSIAHLTRNSEKCCKQLERFVLSCLARAFKYSKPLPAKLERHSLSVEEYQQALACQLDSDQSFEAGFEYGISYALRRLGMNGLPPEWAAWASQDSSGNITYHEEKPIPVQSYGRHSSTKQQSRPQVGSTFHWFYSVRSLK